MYYNSYGVVFKFQEGCMNNFLTVPNLLSIFRILMIPVIVVMSNNDLTTAAGITVLVSGLTDILDGYIARRFNQVSTIGKALDPIADYLTQIVIVYLIAKRHPVVMLLFIILLVKQLVMGVAGLMFINKSGTTFSAKWWGKLSTFALYASMIVILLFPDMPNWLITTLTIVCTALALFSLMKYIPVYIDAFKNKNRRGLK